MEYGVARFGTDLGFLVQRNRSATAAKKSMTKPLEKQALRRLVPDMGHHVYFHLELIRVDWNRLRRSNNTVNRLYL